MTEAELERVLADAVALPIKARLRLLAMLRDSLAVDRDGIRITVDSPSEYKRARKQQPSDEGLRHWLETFGPGDVFYDVGANTGLVALRCALMHGGRVPVYAFEVASDTFAALVRNVFANDVAGVVTPLHVALFDETGVRPLHRWTIGAGSAMHAVGEPVNYERQRFVAAAVEPVLAFRLDDLVTLCGLPAPTRLKLDVDGVEHRVLAGAEHLLASSRCEIFVELVEAAAGDQHPARITAFLNGLGYELAHVVAHAADAAYPRITDALFVRR